MSTMSTMSTTSANEEIVRKEVVQALAPIAKARGLSLNVSVSIVDSGKWNEDKSAILVYAYACGARNAHDVKPLVPLLKHDASTLTWRLSNIRSVLKGGKSTHISSLDKHICRLYVKKPKLFKAVFGKALARYGLDKDGLVKKLGRR